MDSVFATVEKQQTSGGFAWVRRLLTGDYRQLTGDFRQLRPFLLLFVPISMAFFGLWQLSHYFDGVLENRQRRVATLDATERASEVLLDTINLFAADLRIIAQDQNLQRLVAGEISAREGVARSFSIMVRERPEIVQLRFLDDTGTEVVRIDRQGNSIRTAHPIELQVKDDRYYFENAINLSQGGLYISPIDLNIERGEIETPWKPVLRLAMPITLPNGVNVGVVVVNLSAAELIARIGQFNIHAGIALQLLNDDGYWLSGAPHDMLWGFMFGRETTMAITAPEIWGRILEYANGSFDSGGDYYVFRTVQPVDQLSSTSPVFAGVSSDIGWTILGEVPAEKFTDGWQMDHLPVALVGLLLIATVSLGWSRAAIARGIAEVNKRKTEAEMVRVERLASLGGLVAGVAHELNTPIGSAVTVASTLSENTVQLGKDIGAGQVRRSVLENFLKDTQGGTAILLRSLERASELIGHFKQIAVDQTSEQRRTFRIDDLVDDIVGTMRPRFKQGGVNLAEGIASSVSLDSYPGPLSQVLINLIENAHFHAFDADDDDATGTVTVLVRNLPWKAVEIIVRDTGKGMAPEILDRIFEPFFTTRLGQNGSGLGLSIVFNVVTGTLGGTIRAESTPGKGTSMIIHLPLSAPILAANYSERTYNV